MSNPAHHGPAGGGLARLARRIAARPDLWRPRLRHDPAQRGFFRLFATPEMEAWILTWCGAQAIELHDHGGSAGAVLVVEGMLVECATSLKTAAPLRRRLWPEGSLHRFDASHVHDLQHVGLAPATSVHVYAPRLTTMTFYDHRAAHFLAPLRVEAVAGDPAGAPATAAAGRQ